MSLNGHTSVSNAGSGNLSAYQVNAEGTADLIKPTAASIAPGAPIDSALASENN
jgi:hypothetical protein